MANLRIDIETRSSVDIGKAGLFKYAESSDFEILLFAYKLDDFPTQIIDLKSGEKLPEWLIAALSDPRYTKFAYNAAFEWFCLNMAGYKTDLNHWQCSMIHGLYLGYPAGLGAIGAAMGLPEDKQKLATGKALIRYFCNPCKPTKSNGGRTWNDPHHDPEKWQLFKDYCIRDVDTEYEIDTRLEAFEVPDSEWKLWRCDVLMNAYGARVDIDLIDGALEIDADSTNSLLEEACRLTGLNNPNSSSQLSKWLSSKGVEVENLQKSTVSKLLETDLPADVKRVLEIRQQLGKTSVSKYTAMVASKGGNNRVRGLMQFYGANKTGRWAGRLVQIQNLPRNYIEDLEGVRKLIKARNKTGIELIYGNVPDTLSQLIRTAFIPSDGRKFVVADFSAIEARVIAWLAGEEWVNEVFATHGKIYEATASQMFHVPLELIKKGNPEYALRQKGKVATLALGYQGGVNALIAMGALDMGLSEDELPEIVERWRAANPNIKKLWYDIGEAALRALKTAQPQYVKSLVIRHESDLKTSQTFLTIELPSGRKLSYVRPFIDVNQFGREAVHFFSIDQTTKKWRKESTYGGKLVENCVQGIARDCLAVTLNRIWDKGLDIVFHVHDEVIVDAPMDLTVEALCNLMSEPIDWAPGLVLKGAGFESDFYMKD